MRNGILLLFYSFFSLFFLLLFFLAGTYNRMTGQIYVRSFFVFFLFFFIMPFLSRFLYVSPK